MIHFSNDFISIGYFKFRKKSLCQQVLVSISPTSNTASNMNVDSSITVLTTIHLTIGLEISKVCHETPSTVTTGILSVFMKLILRYFDNVVENSL